MSLFDAPKNEGAAAGQAIGSYAGSALPVPYVGSFLGGAVGKLVGGIFGGGEKRVTLGVSLKPNAQGLYETNFAGTKGASVAQAQDYAGSIGGILNQFADVLGLKYTSGFSSETNIGNKDRKTVFNNTVISGTPGDVQGVALKVLKNENFYSLGSDEKLNAAFKQSVSKASTLGEVAADIDAYMAAKTNAENETKAKEAQDVSKDAKEPYKNFVTLQDSNDPLSRITASTMTGRNAFVLIGLAALVIMLKSKG